MADVIPFGCQMPGADYPFDDITHLFLEASKELEPDTVLFMENFTLQESMSALEIGEPRLDTGLIVREQIRPPFNPLTPLLPEEVCWILDKALAYEMEFHGGNFLAHTVHTLLYVHHLRELDPDVVISPPTADPSRPIELLTVVLQTGVQGLLKCCDLAWRELAKGGAYDAEDWQSDKCEVSLLEGMPVSFVTARLDDAVDWLLESSVPIGWRNALRARLLLRKTMLQVMSSNPSTDRHGFQTLVLLAKDYLHTVESNPSPEYGPDSTVHLSFDPYVGRRLQTATPIRIVTPPSFRDTCKHLGLFLDGLYEAAVLETYDQLSTWKIVGKLQAWSGKPPRVPYIRSFIQSIFYDGVLVLNKYPFEWMVNRFFLETIGVSYDTIKAEMTQGWFGDDPEPPFRKVERSLYKLITPHIRSLWNNPPRKRRYSMKSLVEWHNLYETLLDIRDNVVFESHSRSRILKHIPDAALLWRLSEIREIVLSGFQLELYAKGEKSFAYWYTGQVIDTQLLCLENLVGLVDEGFNLHKEILYQIQLLTALQSLCIASFIITLPLTSFDWTRSRPNFFRRYKWAFRAEYDVHTNMPVAQPDLQGFVDVCGNVVLNGNPVPTEPVFLARTILGGLIASNNVGGWAGYWARDRLQLLQKLMSVCDDLMAHLPNTPEAMDVFNTDKLKWDPEYHPWFPSLLPSVLPSELAEASELAEPGAPGNQVAAAPAEASMATDEEVAAATTKHRF